MKRLLIFDTETNDKAKHFGKAEDDLNNYPYVVQFAGKIIEIDETVQGFNPKVIYTFNELVKPIRDKKEIKIAPEASKVHGISIEEAFEKGKDIEDIAYLFHGMANSIDFLIAHNIQFDRNVMASELLRLGIKPLAKRGCRSFCSMKYTTDMIKLPNPKYPNSFKFPRLDEIYQYYFKESMNTKYKAHDAMEDVEALTDCILVMLMTDNNFSQWIKGEIEDIY